MSDREGRGGRRAGGGSLALAKLQNAGSRTLYRQEIQSVMSNVSPECKLLTAYVGHFYKVTCVTH